MEGEHPKQDHRFTSVRCQEPLGDGYEPVLLPGYVVNDSSPFPGNIAPRADLTLNRSLSFIIRDITKRLYYDNVGSPPPLSCAETLTETFNLSYKLSEWHGNVPRALRPGEGLEKQYTRHQPLETRRLQVALSFRYSGACILLHRPILQKLWDFNSDSTSLELTLLKGTGFLSLRSCMDTCRDAIQVGTSIVKEINRQTNLLGAWWFTTYYSEFVQSLPLLSPG